VTRVTRWSKQRPVRFLFVILAAISAVALGASIVLGATIAPLATLSDSVHVNRDGIKFQTKGPTDYAISTLTFAPGANSGWHHHPGIIWVLVEQGQVTISDAACQTTTYRAGQVFLEGGNEPMLASNEGSTNAVVYNMQVVPHGAPFKVPDDPPSCAAS